MKKFEAHTIANIMTPSLIDFSKRQITFNLEQGDINTPFTEYAVIRVDTLEATLRTLISLVDSAQSMGALSIAETQKYNELLRLTDLNAE